MKKQIKQIIAAGMIASCMATAAQAEDVACPSADSIKGTVRALNTVMRQSETGYFVFTAQPALNESGHGWLVMSQTRGKGFDSAYSNGQNDVKSVVAAATANAVEMQGVLLCAYMTSGGGMSVMALAQQQQGLVFNPANLKLDSLKK